MNDTFFTSDTHFSHRNVIEYENRPFSSVEEMDEVLIENWNKTVKPHDDIIHLGDVAFCRASRLEEISKRLNGNKKLVRGNHDTATVTKWTKMGWDVIGASDYEAYPHITPDGYGFYISHRPLAFPQGLNVHGHTHSKIEGLDQSIYKCVSVELTGYKPIHIDEIKAWAQRVRSV